MKYLRRYEDIEIPYATGNYVKQNIVPWDVSEILIVKNIPDNINGNPVIYRGISSEELTNIINGGKSGQFWRGEPMQYRNYGEYLLVTEIPDNFSKNPSKGDKEEYDSFNIVGYSVTRENPIIIIDKRNSEIIFNNI